MSQVEIPSERLKKTQKSRPVVSHFIALLNSLLVGATPPLTTSTIPYGHIAHLQTHRSPAGKHGVENKRLFEFLLNANLNAI